MNYFLFLEEQILYNYLNIKKTPHKGLHGKSDIWKHIFTCSPTCTQNTCTELRMLFFNFRGAYGHDVGKRPWIIGDESIVDLMKDIVGKCKMLWTFFPQ